MEKKTRNSLNDLVCADFARTSAPLGNASTLSDYESMFRLANSQPVPSNRLTYVRNNLSSERREDYNSWIEQLMHKPRSLSEEMELRDCLIRSITDLCKYITETTSLDGNELDLLISEKCVTDEDRVHIDADRMGPMKRTRRLLSLILLRDYRTILVFLKSLLYYNEHVVDKVLFQFDQNVRRNYRKSPKCTLCHLVNRVDMFLFIDDLLCGNDQWLMFYVKVSQTDCVGPNTKFWQELINLVDAGDGHVHTSLIITKALSSCGFHSDIVKMLNEDIQLQRNSFACRCSEMEHLLFSSKSKVIVSLNEDRPKMVERVHEEATEVKCLDWNRQQHHTTNDRPSDSNTNVHQMLLKTDLRKQEPKIETLKTRQLRGEKSTSNGNGGEQQTSEVHDNQMTLLKEVVSREEQEEATRWSDGTNCYDSLDADKHHLQKMKTDVPESENEHGRSEHEMELLKIGLPEHEINSDDGFSSCQSEQSFDNSDKEVERETITTDCIEPSHQHENIFQNISISLQDSPTEARAHYSNVNDSDDGFSSCQSEQSFDNSDKEVERETITTDFIEPSHQHEKICQNISISLQDSPTEARAHYSNVNDSDDGFSSCQSEQFFDSSDKEVERETITNDFIEPSNQLEKICQNRSNSPQDSQTEARADCSNTNVTSSEVVNFLIIVTIVMCFFSYLVQNISAYLWGA